jgi:hypothetical protein
MSDIWNPAALSPYGFGSHRNPWRHIITGDPKCGDPKCDDDTVSLIVNVGGERNMNNCFFCNKVHRCSNYLPRGDIKNSIWGCRAFNEYCEKLIAIIEKRKPCNISREDFSVDVRGKKHIFYTCGNRDIDTFYIHLYLGKYNVQSVLNVRKCDFSLIGIEERTTLVENAKKILKELDTFKRRNIIIAYDEQKLVYLRNMCNYIINFDEEVFKVKVEGEEMLIKIYPRTPKPILPSELREHENEPIVIPLQNADSDNLFGDSIKIPETIPETIKKVFLEYQLPFKGNDNLQICALTPISAEVVFCLKKLDDDSSMKIKVDMLGHFSAISVLNNNFEFSKESIPNIERVLCRVGLPDSLLSHPKILNISLSKRREMRDKFLLERSIHKS